MFVDKGSGVTIFCGRTNVSEDEVKSVILERSQLAESGRCSRLKFQSTLRAIILDCLRLESLRASYFFLLTQKKVTKKKGCPRYCSKDPIKW
mgnify:CR=1 FL=1